MKVSLVLCHFSSFRFRFYLFSEIVSKLKASLAQKHTIATDGEDSIRVGHIAHANM